MIKVFKNQFVNFRPTFWSSLFSILGIIILISLGVWQLQRLEWKNQLISQRASAFQLPPVELTLSEDDSSYWNWKKVKITGSFDNSNELYLAARSLRGNVGFHVLTPFNILETNKYILVNRGWVPREKINPNERKIGQIYGEVSIIGIANPGFKKGPFSPANDLNKNVWLYMDYEEMSKFVGYKLKPLVIDAVESGPGGLPIGGQTRIKIPNDHLQYSVTWFLFAITLLLVWFFWNKKRIT
ncbi:SURF1 family protein [Alphaproteobacteria bacterium]|nr:SURF1 family protein [Alphaproteobacteria bacterium]